MSRSRWGAAFRSCACCAREWRLIRAATMWWPAGAVSMRTPKAHRSGTWSQATSRREGKSLQRRACMLGWWMAETEVRPIRTKRDYEAALNEVDRLWGAKAGTRDGDRLDVLATLIDAYEAEHYPMDPPDPVETIKNSGL